MGLPEFAPYTRAARTNVHKSDEAFATGSDFDSTLEKLSPHLLARLSLHPGDGGSPGTPGSSSSGAGTPSEAASSGSRRLGSGQHRRRRNRSWAKTAPFPDLVAPPGLGPPSRSSMGSLPSPPYSADVDRAFRQRTNVTSKPFDRPRSAESTPGSTPYRGVPLPPTHESPPSGSGRTWDPPDSHPRPSSHRLHRQQHPRKLQLSDAGQRLLRAGQRAGSDAGSEESAPSQTCAHATSLNSGAASGPGQSEAVCSTPEDRKAAKAAGKHSDTMSPRLEIYASARSEKELADDLAMQMALQAQQLVAERADMAARNAELARENAQLMARLEFLEESRVAAAGDGGNAAEDGDLQQQQQLEELGFLHDLLHRAEEEKALLEWQLQQKAVSVAELPDSFGPGLS
ncbi:hypothetical protein WJX75_003576 [Coccomyxa subellipsoidea]|uniref:Uncharacterized protein n=1 Tax=Coccomyxa subellipsoidea TaxID=248742 RepID=A0ABR2YAW8_9CHLO